MVYTILIILGALIASIIFGDVFTNDLNKQNPYLYDLAEFKRVDPSLIKYRETKRIKTEISKPKAIDYHEGFIGIAYENYMQVIDTAGIEYLSKIINDTVTSISFAPEGQIFLGCKNHIKIFDPNGDLLDEWDMNSSRAYITSVAFKENEVFIADAGGPVVHRFKRSGERINSFDGKGPRDKDIGFVIPSPYFDIAIDPENQLWVANTGRQSIQNYTETGSLRAHWGKPSFSIQGFAGCCNPVQFSILSNGNFVTCEKGIVRIKVYNPAGELESVVASPADFELDSEAADLTIDDNDDIYALDVSRQMIRKFERKRING